MSKDKTKNGGQPENNDYRDEMEELARIFKEELDKAVQDAEDAAQIEDLDTIEVEGYNPKELSLDESKKPAAPLSEDMLCECCGERPRGTKKNPDSVFCEDCEAILEKYPYDWKGVLAIVVVMGIVISAFILFASNVPLFSKMKLGDKALNEKKLYTAMTKYDEAVSCINEEDLPRYYGLFAKRVKAEYMLLDMSTAMAECEEYLPDSVLKLPTFKETKKITADIDEMYASAYSIQNHLADFAASDYEGIIEKLNSLSGKKIYEKNGQYHDETEEDYTPDGTETVYTYNEGWLNLYKYSAARVAEKDEAELIAHLEKTAENSDYLKRFVLPLLASTCVGAGSYEKAEAFLEEIKLQNSESPDCYMIQSMLYRYRDKDYENAIKICDEGLNMIYSLTNGEDVYESVGYILLMQISLNLTMQAEELEGSERTEKLTEAFELTNQADYLYSTVNHEQLIEFRDLYVILGLALNNSEPYDEAAEEIEAAGEKGIAFTEDVTNYKDGKITLSEIAMSGRYDLQ
ncbi:MAG: hypothetical protein ACI4SX_07475 [Candidatus Fimenecus sp.]